VGSIAVVALDIHKKFSRAIAMGGRDGIIDSRKISRAVVARTADARSASLSRPASLSVAAGAYSRSRSATSSAPST
jgi:hypothetical protein